MFTSRYAVRSYSKNTYIKEYYADIKKNSVPKKYRITIWFSNSTFGHIPTGIESRCQRDIYTTMFIVALFTIARSWE